MGLNTLGLAHRFIQNHIRPGDFWIDATAGKGRDTVFLCSLVGDRGKVLAFDIQEQAVNDTRELVEQSGYAHIAQVILQSHSEMDRYAEEESVDGVVFNLGYLPGGDHKIFTTAQTSIPAIEKGLRLLRPGGVMSICIYYGGDSGYEEKDALMEFLKTIDDRQYTVLMSQFYNRPNDPPIPVMIYKEPAAF